MHKQTSKGVGQCCVRVRAFIKNKGLIYMVILYVEPCIDDTRVQTFIKSLF